jgi:hypothetical protein
MSARSPLESPRDAAAGDVLRAVGAARRRLRTVATLRLIAIAAPAGVTVGAALVIAGWAAAETPPVLGVVGAVAAAVWAAARTPPLAAVARILDARLGLRDRVAAAVQLQTTDGPIAALVARDAAARLASVRMATVFPLAMGRLPAVAIALAIASMAWLTSSHAGPPVAAPARSTSSNSAGAGDASSRTSSDPRGVATNAQPRPNGQAATLRAAEPRGQDGRGSAKREAFAPAAASRGPQGAQPSAASAPGSSVNTAGASRQAAAAPAAASATGPIGPTGRGGAAAGTAASGRMAAGAGGTAPGNRLASPGSEPAAPVATVSYRAARANAEAALARDVIPPDYRDHVRAYFRALPAPYTSAGGTR